MVASWMASTKAFLFDFDGTLARLNIDFQALRLEVLALAREFGIQEPLLTDPPYLLELAGVSVQKDCPRTAAGFLEFEWDDVIPLKFPVREQSPFGSGFIQKLE